MQQQHNTIHHVVIVGGGTAGWLTAGRIAAQYPQGAGRQIKVTLVESPDIKPIGVGEGTWPTLRSTLMKLGISETDFIRHCDATFKQGAKFCQWLTGTPDDYYYHPLMLPQGFDKVDIAAGWRAIDPQRSFSNSVCFQEQVCEQGLGPKLISTAEFGSIANYAYHLDAGKFSEFLRQHVTEKLGVTHLLENVVGVNSAQNGDIESLITDKAVLAGDLFVDCTGFSSLLLGKHFKVPFIDHSDVLFIDQALAVQSPYDNIDAPIASHTISTAQKAGWIWDIGLQTRRGVGHVYSSRHTSKQSAEDALSQYLGSSNLNVKHIPIACGHREVFWQNNCVAVGLAAGFLEPLEASALVLVELSATMLAEQLPHDRQAVDIVAKRFNSTFKYRWDRVIDFLKLHYMLSRRTDSAFWLDNRAPETIPERLKELILLWRHRAPGNYDFDSNNEVFPAASYQYVLYGMGFVGALDQQHLASNTLDLARQMMAQNQRATQKAIQLLPKHRDLIEKIKMYGLAAV
ncbi:tryptophan 7-halogenase [Simiduia curdlanivorans]|uniref:Tryptophan halogenase family protein n=1 Tax=Simiduia curdlanivorans TaxID=1492769 RepID=A0ABV8V765_9GAMM|nr:tryptophan halogenase family protein [Simiduia curdlanivorans]MDN3640724.1 tryptophan 7-halogenase [Simiduia curdlanivorans]